MIIKVDYKISGGGLDCDQVTFLESGESDPVTVVKEYFKDMWGPETQYDAMNNTYHSTDFSTAIKIRGYTVIDSIDAPAIRKYFNVIAANPLQGE